MAPAVLVVVITLLTGHAFAEPGRYAECAGRIVRASNGENTTFEQIVPDLTKADFILFGERHGVREQAQASACVLSAMVQANKPAALVMEMLSRGDQKAIDGWRKKHPESPSGLGVELRWWERGWPAFENWLPLLDRAFALRVPLFGGDLGQAEASRRTLTPKQENMLLKRLGKRAQTIVSGWQAAMTDAHCGLIDGKEARQLGFRQARRDLSIADTAREARPANGMVLVQAGRGHSRKDRSLYAALADKNPQAVISIGAFVSEEEIKPSDRQAHDYLWIVGSDPQVGKPCAFNNASNSKVTSP